MRIRFGFLYRDLSGWGVHLACAALALLWASRAAVAPAADPIANKDAEIISVKKIGDRAPHNAFTDLARFKDRFYCVYREGQDHVSPDGALRILSSADGETWESAALIQSEKEDLRDAKIRVTPDGRLFLGGAGALHDTSKHTHQSYVWFSDDGKVWGDAIPVGDPDFWIWRVTHHKDAWWGVGYGCRDHLKSARLYSAPDGVQFKPIVETLSNDGYPTEATLHFLKDDTCLCLVRRDEGNRHAYLGTARSPYTEWHWKDLGAALGGPHLIELPDGRLLASGRLYDQKERTSLLWLDKEAGKLTEFLTLPSGGDTSYPGLVLHEGLLYVSYYSSHEGKSSVYLAKVKLK